MNRKILQCAPERLNGSSAVMAELLGKMESSELKLAEAEHCVRMARIILDCLENLQQLTGCPDPPDFRSCLCDLREDLGPSRFFPAASGDAPERKEDDRAGGEVETAAAS